MQYCSILWPDLYCDLQVADLNRGAFGFVQLAKDMETGEQVAIKFIERGDKVLWPLFAGLSLRKLLWMGLVSERECL